MEERKVSLFRMLWESAINPKKAIEQDYFSEYKKWKLYIIIYLLSVILASVIFMNSEFGLTSGVILGSLIVVPLAMFITTKIIVLLYYFGFYNKVKEEMEYKDIERVLLPFMIIMLIGSILLMFVGQYYKNIMIISLNIIPFIWFNIQVYRVINKRFGILDLKSTMKKLIISICCISLFTTVQYFKNDMVDKKPEVSNEVHQVCIESYNSITEKMKNEEKISKELEYEIDVKLRTHGRDSLTRDELDLIKSVRRMYYANIDYFDAKEKGDEEEMKAKLELYESSDKKAKELLGINQIEDVNKIE